MEPEYIKRSNLLFKDILKGIYQKSYLLRFLKRKIYDRARNAQYLRSPEIRVEEAKMSWRNAAKKTYVNFPSLDNFKKNINSMIGIAKANGVRICVMTQPHLYSENMTEEEKRTLWRIVDNYSFLPDIATFFRGMNLYNAEVKRICREQNVECIDLASEMPKDIKYLSDSVHYNPEGARLVADIVGDYLWDKKELFRMKETENK